MDQVHKIKTNLYLTATVVTLTIVGAKLHSVFLIAPVLIAVVARSYRLVKLPSWTYKFFKVLLPNKQFCVADGLEDNAGKAVTKSTIVLGLSVVAAGCAVLPGFLAITYLCWLGMFSLISMDGKRQLEAENVMIDILTKNTSNIILSSMEKKTMKKLFQQLINNHTFVRYWLLREAAEYQSYYSTFLSNLSKTLPRRTPEDKGAILENRRFKQKYEIQKNIQVLKWIWMAETT